MLLHNASYVMLVLLLFASEPVISSESKAHARVFKMEDNAESAGHSPAFGGYFHFPRQRAIPGYKVVFFWIELVIL